MPPDGSRNLEGEVDRLGYAISNLTDAVRNLRTDLAGLRDNMRSDLGVIREGMRTDFTRLLERQDSQFRWLFGLIFVAAVSIGVTLFRLH